MNSPALKWHEIKETAYAAGVLFVTTEFDLAMTFASSALRSALWSSDSSGFQWTDRVSRNERFARVAYDSAIRYMARIKLKAADSEQLAAKQQQVEAALEQLTPTN